jgi:replicative DNA helicase
VALLGLVASELYVLGARTSAGKTTLLVQIAHHVAIHHGPGRRPNPRPFSPF